MSRPCNGVQLRGTQERHQLERHQLGRFSPIRQHATHHVALGRAASFTRVVFLQKGQVPRSARVANAVALQA